MLPCVFRRRIFRNHASSFSGFRKIDGRRPPHCVNQPSPTTFLFISSASVILRSAAALGEGTVCFQGGAGRVVPTWEHEIVCLPHRKITANFAGQECGPWNPTETALEIHSFNSLLSAGGEAVLGPSLPAGKVSGSSGRVLPPEMRISRQKLRPGSGVLSVKVVTDGPTRVLQITDINQQVRALL